MPVTSPKSLAGKYILLKSRDTGLERVAYCEYITKGGRFSVSFARSMARQRGWTKPAVIDEAKWIVVGPAPRERVNDAIKANGRHPCEHYVT
jgi:hypothetical protein